jgi:hypothetical protein
MNPGLLSLLALAAAAKAASPPNDGWVLKRGEETCSLVRETQGKAAATMVVRTLPGSDFVDLLLVTRNWSGPINLIRDEVDVILEPSGYRAAEPAISIKSGERAGITVGAMGDEFVKNLSGASELRVVRGKRSLANVAIPGAAAAVARLRACENVTMRKWGFDPEVLRSLSRAPVPIGSPGQWFSDKDYPGEAIQTYLQGRVLTRLVIGTDGRVAECVVVEGRHPVLDRRTCEILLSRGRYQPALSAAGEPVRALTPLRPIWRLIN